MGKTLSISVEAEEEITNAYDHYQQQRTGLEIEFLNSIDQSLQRIAEHPHHYHYYQNSIARACKVKSFPFQIVFIDEEEVIKVIAVFHTSRNQNRLEERI